METKVIYQFTNFQVIIVSIAVCSVVTTVVKGIVFVEALRAAGKEGNVDLEG